MLNLHGLCSGGVFTQEVAFEEFLGETLDGVYKKAGVLVAVAQEASDDDEES